jgi:hypothetical protein
MAVAKLAGSYLKTRCFQKTGHRHRKRTCARPAAQQFQGESRGRWPPLAFNPTTRQDVGDLTLKGVHASRP